MTGRGGTVQCQRALVAITGWVNVLGAGGREVTLCVLCSRSLRAAIDGEQAGCRQPRGGRSARSVSGTIRVPVFVSGRRISNEPGPNAAASGKVIGGPGVDGAGVGVDEHGAAFGVEALGAFERGR